jgi:hypothetical protein
MAARENQGLQIALIVFVTLTVLLSVTTFFFFRNYQTEQQKSKTNEESAQKAMADKSKAEGDRDQLLEHIGMQKTDKIEAANDAWDKDMKGYEPLLPTKLAEEQKNYKKLVEGLAGVVRSQHLQLQQSAANLSAAKANYDQKTKDYEQAIKKLTDDQTKVVNDYLAERERITKQLEELTVSKDQLAKEGIDKDKAMAEQKQQFDVKIAALQKTLDTVKQQLSNRSEDLNKLSGKFSVGAQPDGKIIWVNQTDNLAYISLGSADRLRKRVTFSVFDPSTTDVSAVPAKEEAASTVDTTNVAVSEAKRKGVIEVINISQPHMAECRILESNNSHPLLPGDVIFTPLWHPGQQEHFALVGLLDIEGKGTSDRQKIHDIIRVHGGVIDAETDDKGNLQGEITHLTRYLVEGDLAEHEGAKSAAGNNKLIGDAKTMGVEVIDLSRFLDLMGYTPGADEKSATAQNLRAPDPGQPVNNFRARIPPTPSKAAGAY